jgi:parallel beta-helix repeat protein
MNKITKDIIQFIQKSEFHSLLFLIAVLIFICTGCKKEQALTDVQQSQASLDLSAAKADIVVHTGGSIQAAVDAAQPGMLIKIEPGTYSEAITVTKPGIKLIGLTKNGAGVIIKNPADKEDGITVTDDGDGFSLQNVTVQGFEENGVVLDGVDNFCISHVTAINNGEYGIFPVHSSHGVIDHCIVSGHTDTGIYVGQSSDVNMQFNIAFKNVNGLEVENSSNVNVINNQSYNNVCGILIDLLPGKDIKTSTGVYVGNNQVHNNNHINFGEPGSLESVVPPGLGILILGTDETTVENNTVTGNNFAGITVFSTLVIGALAGLPPEYFADIEPNPDGARIRKNVVQKNGAVPPPLPIPLPGVDLLWDGSGTNNCWSNNHFKTSYPSPLPLCN